jgi:hypothetical protein
MMKIIIPIMSMVLLAIEFDGGAWKKRVGEGIGTGAAGDD